MVEFIHIDKLYIITDISILVLGGSVAYFCLFYNVNIKKFEFCWGGGGIGLLDPPLRMSLIVEILNEYDFERFI